VPSRRAFNCSLLAMGSLLTFGSAARAEDQVKTSSIGTVAGQTDAKAKLATRTEVVIDRGEVPMISPGSIEFMDNAIAMYEEIVAGGGWQQLPARTLTKGNKGDSVIALRQRLVSENYLPFDSLSGANAAVFDDELTEAVRAFQINHGVLPSGTVAEKTLAQLNVTAEDRLAALRENLPRIQIFAQGLGRRYILVNIPGTQLEAVENGQVYSRHNVVAGKLERPSPTLISKVSDINFNPYWKIPASIVENDIVPHYLEDPNYLAANHIRVFDGIDGPEIDPLLIDWETTPPERYFFRQDPGEFNSLGLVKINFPNPHMVYMHDTPHRELFGRNVRFESSGCIRVDEVRTLVNWVIDGQDGFDDTQYEMITASQENTEFPVTDGPDVRFMYLTAWATEDGRVNFRPDIYGLDGTGFILGQPEPKAI